MAVNMAALLSNHQYNAINKMILPDLMPLKPYYDSPTSELSIHDGVEYGAGRVLKNIKACNRLVTDQI